MEQLTLVDNFISREESQKVREIVKSLDDLEDAIQVGGVIARFEIVRVQTLIWQRRVYIQNLNLVSRYIGRDPTVPTK